MNQRPYRTCDLTQLTEVYRASIHSLAAPYYTQEQLAAWAPPVPDSDRWQRRLALLHTVVAEHDGIIAGFIAYDLDGHIDMLFTHPRFARRGVATRLYTSAELALRSAGVLKVFTEASLAARPFFEHCGFVVDAEELVECRGLYLRRFAMHKRIDAAASAAGELTVS